MAERSTKSGSELGEMDVGGGSYKKSGTQSGKRNVKRSVRTNQTIAIMTREQL